MELGTHCSPLPSGSKNKALVYMGVIEGGTLCHIISGTGVKSTLCNLSDFLTLSTEYQINGSPLLHLVVFIIFILNKWFCA